MRDIGDAMQPVIEKGVELTGVLDLADAAINTAVDVKTGNISASSITSTVVDVGVNIAIKKIKMLRAAVHGNSKNSSKPQHLYSIIDLTDGSVYKYGISGGVLNKNGTSRRANTQANALNKIAGFRRYKPIVITRGIKGRVKALALEYAFVYGYQEATGAKPIGNIRP